MSVSCRRSLATSPEARLVSEDGFGAEGAGAAVERSAIADKILRRCPIKETPRSFKSSELKFGKTSQSISFSLNELSYCPRPRLRTQFPTSIPTPYNQPTYFQHQFLRTPRFDQSSKLTAPIFRSDQTP